MSRAWWFCRRSPAVPGAAIPFSVGRNTAATCLRAALVTSIVLALAGCAVRLAPSYDQAIFDGLTKANEEAMTLFAATSAGVSSGTFSTKREKAYDGLIGKLDAVRLQAVARPDPQPGPFLALVLPKIVGKPSDQPDTNPLASPTSRFAANMARIFTRMRDRDKKNGLKPQHVALYKNEFEFEMDNALTYEKALNR